LEATSQIAGKNPAQPGHEGLPHECQKMRNFTVSDEVCDYAASHGS
jgi:hypothetical protein